MQTEVQREEAGGLPIVLDVSVIDALFNGVHLLLRRRGVIDVAQQEIAQGVAGIGSIEVESGSVRVGCIYEHGDALLVRATFARVPIVVPRDVVVKLPALPALIADDYHMSIYA